MNSNKVLYFPSLFFFPYVPWFFGYIFPEERGRSNFVGKLAWHVRLNKWRFSFEIGQCVQTCPFTQIAGGSRVLDWFIVFESKIE